jgi:hypothetical protein
MANTIRIKRRASGGGAGAPASLANAELCFNEQTNVLYYGTGTGGSGGSATSVIAIGGSGAFATQAYVATAVAGVSVDLSAYAALAGASFTGNVVVGGNLTVNGTTTTINSTTLTTADKNIELAKGSTTDAAADGGGITIHAAADYTFNWVASTSAWTSSTHIDLASSKAYKIAGTNVLTATALGSGVTSSSLTSVGALTSGSLASGFTAVGVAQGGTGLTSAVSGLLKGNGSAYSAATAGTDYLDGNSTLDCGTF